jgi:hypothetical protein
MLIFKIFYKILIKVFYIIKHIVINSFSPPCKSSSLPSQKRINKLANNKRCYDLKDEIIIKSIELDKAIKIHYILFILPFFLMKNL